MEAYNSQGKIHKDLDQTIFTEKIKKIQNYHKFLEKYNFAMKDINPFFTAKEPSTRNKSNCSHNSNYRLPNDENSIREKNLRKLK